MRGSVRMTDSRRLTGPNLLLSGAGAVIECQLEGLEAGALAAAWQRSLDRVLVAVGWPHAVRAWRAWPGGMSLAFAAPIDALYAATEVNEWAFADAVASLAAGDPPAPLDSAVATLRAGIAEEANPRLLALAAAAEARGLTFLWDDRRVSIGLGEGSRSWPAREITAPERVRWAGLRDVPLVMVTGTNGKSTTVRLLAAMLRAAGRVAGVTSTDRVEVGDQVVAEGDYSGPNGARTVLRDRRVQVGVLEVARGGILRRGLPVPRADAIVVTNVARDHLGEYGIHDVEALADAKLVVARAVGPQGRAVLNGDDPRVLARGLVLDCPVLWCTLDAGHATLRAHLAAGGDAAWVEHDALQLAWRGERHTIAPVAEVPVTFGGAARYNVANVLAAIGAAAVVGVPVAAMREGLLGFESTPAANPGRANRWVLGGFTAIVDFAHNPHGLEALAQMAAAIPAQRRAIVIGQAGDRSDDDIRAFARSAWAMRPERVFIKEMDSYRRGREPGVIPGLLAAEFAACGAAAAQLSQHPDESSAVRAALAWAAAGDLLVLTSHAEREAVIALLEDLRRRGWAPGQSLPR